MAGRSGKSMMPSSASGGGKGKGQMANPTSASSRNSPNRRANANASAGGGTMKPATATKFPEIGPDKFPPHVHRGGPMGVIPRTTIKAQQGDTVPGAGNCC